jgi:hypothetical protein
LYCHQYGNKRNRANGMSKGGGMMEELECMETIKPEGIDIDIPERSNQTKR